MTVYVIALAGAVVIAALAYKIGQLRERLRYEQPKVCQLLTKRGKLYAILMLLTSCTPSISGSFCDVYEPVYLDYKNDTAETIRQVDRNNAVHQWCK